MPSWTALNEALTAEVQRLKIATAELGDSCSSNNLAQQLQLSAQDQMFQLQHQQQQATPIPFYQLQQAQQNGAGKNQDSTEWAQRCFMGENKRSIALDELKEFDFLTHWFLNVVNNHRVFFQVMNLLVLLYVYLFFGWYSCCLWPNWSKCSWFIFFCTTTISLWLMFSAAWYQSMQTFISAITLSRLHLLFGQVHCQFQDATNLLWTLLQHMVFKLKMEQQIS